MSVIPNDDRRTRKANRNALYSLGIRGVDSIVQLLLVPVTLGYLNAYEYGIWLTLSSILLWVNSFDIGLGNGLRNQLATAVALGDMKLARILVSTAYCMITLVMLTIFFIGSVIILNVNWYHILNVEHEVIPNLLDIVYITFALFCLNFVVKFIGNVYLAMQMPAVNNLFVALGHLLSLLVISALTLLTSGSLFAVALAFSISPIVVYFASYPITFLYAYRELRPSIFLFRKKYLRGLFNIGLLFFLLQISGLILFALSNVIISNLFGPDQVTPYNISYRYFSLINLFTSITVAPMWSAVTDAYAKNDMIWIKNSMKRCRKLLLFCLFIIMLMLLASNMVYRLWVELTIDSMLSFLMAIYAFELSWSLCYSYFLNGMGLLKLQAINTVIMAILFFPVCYMMGSSFGINGVVLSMIVINLSGCLLNTWQFHHHIKTVTE